MRSPSELHPQEKLLYWILGPRLRGLVAWLDTTLKTRPARGRILVVGVAVVALVLVMVGFGLDDSQGPKAAILYFAAVVAVFRLFPFPQPKAPPRLDGV